MRGSADFEHKTKEFLAVLDAIHKALKPRRDRVRFRLGARRWVLVAWRIALVLMLAAGIFGAVAAVAVGQHEALACAGVFIAFGVVGLLMLKGKGGPRDYDPADFISARSRGETPVSG